MVDHLTGLRVRIHIDGHAMEKTSLLPPGTIVRELVGANGVVYPIVRFDGPVLFPGSGTEGDRTLTEAVLAPAVEGQSLERLVSLRPGEPLEVGIFTPHCPLDEASDALDASRLTYLAVGRMERA